MLPWTVSRHYSTFFHPPISWDGSASRRLDIARLLSFDSLQRGCLPICSSNTSPSYCLSSAVPWVHFWDVQSTQHTHGYFKLLFNLCLLQDDWCVSFSCIENCSLQRFFSSPICILINWILDMAQLLSVVSILNMLQYSLSHFFLYDSFPISDNLN